MDIYALRTRRRRSEHSRQFLRPFIPPLAAFITAGPAKAEIISTAATVIASHGNADAAFSGKTVSPGVGDPNPACADSAGRKVVTPAGAVTKVAAVFSGLCAVSAVAVGVWETDSVTLTEGDGVGVALTVGVSASAGVEVRSSRCGNRTLQQCSAAVRDKSQFSSIEAKKPSVS